MNDLIKCNKTAWILPKYLAQIYSRSLKKLDKHSDIGISTFNNPYFTLWLSSSQPHLNVRAMKKFEIDKLILEINSHKLCI